MSTREQELAETFVLLADSLVRDFDPAEFLYQLVHRCADLFAVEQAGLMLMEPSGVLHVAAATSHATHLIELLQLQADQGPCLECFRSGEPVTVADLSTSEISTRWPEFAPAAQTAGFRSVSAFPMRLRQQTIGALNLFGSSTGIPGAADTLAAQALADVATISILQNRASDDSRLLVDQLQGALHSRVLIEQAKGIISERVGMGVDTAFETLRTYARNHNLKLADAANGIIKGNIDINELPSH
jgi:GAF domain-containing protein